MAQSPVVVLGVSDVQGPTHATDPALPKCLYTVAPQAPQRYTPIRNIVVKGTILHFI